MAQYVQDDTLENLSKAAQMFADIRQKKAQEDLRKKAVYNSLPNKPTTPMPTVNQPNPSIGMNQPAPFGQGGNLDFLSRMGQFFRR